MDPSAAPPPQGLYVPAKRHGDLIFVSGMTPRRNGELLYVGEVSPDVPVETYRAAVELATENALRAASTQIGEGERLSSALSLTVYVNTPIGYLMHPQIADFASLLLGRYLGEGSLPTRAAIGVASLPGRAVVEVSLVVTVTASG
jgi:enamine deaminase RidA (YjgF/YER057c/UK114 family)